MTFFQSLRQRVKNLGRRPRLIFPESADPRVVSAALRGAREGFFLPVLLLSGEARENLEAGLSPEDKEILEIRPGQPREDASFAKAASTFADLRRGKATAEEAESQVAASPLLFAALLHRLGEVDGVVAGAVHTSGETIADYIRALGPRPGMKTVSSFFLMVRGNPDGGEDEVLLYSDCGLVPYPTEEQLVDIGQAAAESLEELCGMKPRVAYLSFSSKGSAQGPQVDLVREASEKLARRCPEVPVDGELQFDAAYVPAVAAGKAPDSPLEGRANVMIFPNLDAGNIAYKITQRLGGFRALGPLLQGLDGAANDLSRGCSEDDILDVALVTCLQSAMRRP